MANESRYPIKIESNAAQVANEGATALEQFRQRIESSKQSVKNYDDALKALKGDSDDVVTAKKLLTDRINAEKAAISADTRELLKQGTTYQQLQAQQRRLADQSRKMSEETKKQSDERHKAYDANRKAAEEAATAELEFAAGIGAVGLAIAAAELKLAKYAVTQADTLRDQQIAREAFVGNAEDAQHLGNRIDELTNKIPLARSELNAMANDLAQSGVKGNALVDALQAVGSESSALNDKAGSQLKEIITRGKLFQNFALAPLELQGTGLKFQDVATALSKNTKVSVDEATQALIQGRVTMGAGAAALKDAVESRFGKVNAEKLLSLNALETKFHDTAQALAKDIHLEPLQHAFSDLISLLDQGTEAGQGFKELFTFLGQGAVDTFAGATPGLKGFIEELELGALNLEIDYLDLKIQFLETFGPDVVDKIDVFKIGIGAAESAVSLLKTGIEGLVGGPLAVMLDDIIEIGKGLHDLNIEADKTAGFSAKPTTTGGAIGKGAAHGAATVALTTLLGPLAGLIPSFAEGLDYVPQDNFTANLHKGERVLTKDEADAYRRILETSARASGGAAGAASPSGGAVSAGAPVFHQQFSFSGSTTPDQAAAVQKNARQGVLEALEIWARQRGEVVG